MEEGEPGEAGEVAERVEAVDSGPGSVCDMRGGVPGCTVSDIGEAEGVLQGRVKSVELWKGWEW